MIDVTAFRHPALGPMIRLEIPPHSALRLLPAEAATIARALNAVREGRSAEHQIYLSPMADDGEFLADVEEGGLRLGGSLLDWNSVEDLATRLMPPDMA